MKTRLNLVKNFKKKVIDIICSCAPNDRTLMQLVRQLAMVNKPTALKQIDHYLNGSGKGAFLSTQKLFDEDARVFRTFIFEVRRKIARGFTQGLVPISQYSYSNRDWLYSLGRINLIWYKSSNYVTSSFIERYRWHPQEFRITQSLHKAAENLKRQGAREFYIYGTPAKTELDFTMSAWLDDCGKAATLYLL